MSRQTRFASAFLVLAALFCGSLGALPLRAKPASPATDRGGLLTALVDWIAKVFDPDRPAARPREHSHLKEGANMDPNGTGPH